MKTTSEGQNDQTHPAKRSERDMTDENTAYDEAWAAARALKLKKLREAAKIPKPPHGHHNQHSVETVVAVAPELDANSKLDDELRKFEFKRQLKRIQFQVREEFKSDAAKTALELWRSKPLADALNQPGPFDGDLHSKIMPFKGE